MQKKEESLTLTIEFIKMKLSRLFWKLQTPFHIYILIEEFEDTKGVIKIRNSKEVQTTK
jgi:hypothetical protein